MDILHHIPHVRTRNSRKLEKKKYVEALRNGKFTLVMFYSKSCRLCRSLRQPVEEIEIMEKTWLNVATICTDDASEWAPEMLHYDVKTVPTFVMLLPNGDAPMKSGPPLDAQRSLKTLRYFIDKCSMLTSKKTI